MYVYLITNLINNKKYVGITNNYKKRWSNHKSNNNPTMAIAKAIKKYGKENFSFELIESNIPIEKIDEYEQKYIQLYESHVSTGKGYNISKGGKYNIANKEHIGTNNGMALLTEEEVKYIKNNRNLPEYILYEEFVDKITYETFKKIYLNKTYKNIIPNVDPYPFNKEFSSQFNSGKLTYEEVIDLRKKYADKIFWKDIYQKYKTIYPNEMTFWNVYNGNNYKLIMPEVFTEENKHFQASMSHSGSNNGRAKLQEADIKQIRKWFETKEKTRKEIQEIYSSKCSPSTINRILSYKSWKNI